MIGRAWAGSAARGAAFVAMALLAATGRAAAVDHIKIGTLFTAGGGPLYLAVEKGFFAEQGIEAELVPFDAGQPVAVATVAGAIDFGAAGITSALYTFAGQNELRIIAGNEYDSAVHHSSGVIASKAAYAKGLVALKDLGGHSIGLTQIGSSYHYAVAILAEKFGFDMKTIRPLPLQSFANVASAVSGGTADAAVMPTAATLPLVQRGAVKLVGWVGDAVPWQVAVMWTTVKTANGRPDLVRRFLRAVRKGVAANNGAFAKPDGTRADGPTAPDVVAIIGKYVKLAPADIEANVGYVDPELRVDGKDIERQIDWYRSQGMIKVDVTLDQVLDRRYVKLRGAP